MVDKWGAVIEYVNDDWMRVYYDGVLLEEGHQVSPVTFIKLGILLRSDELDENDVKEVAIEEDC